MAVDSISSSSIDLTASYGAKPQQEFKEVHQAGQDKVPDRDSDNYGASEVKPTVNTSGQAIGKIINTKA